MSMLQSIMGRLLGDQGGTDRQQHDMLSGVAGLLNNPQIGGIGGLAKLFENQGLGHLVSAWIGNGPNPPVSPGELQQVLGSPLIAEFARKLGVDPAQAASQLAAILPHAVDQLTPNGTVPASGSMSTQDMLGMLKSKLLDA